MTKVKLLVSSTYPDLWDNVRNVEQRRIVTQTHFCRYRQYHVHLFLFVDFFSGICHLEIDT